MHFCYISTHLFRFWCFGWYVVRITQDMNKYLAYHLEALLCQLMNAVTMFQYAQVL